METLHVKNIGEVIKNKKLLEEKLNVKLNILGNKVTVSGDPLDEYDARCVFDAISFGFSARKSLSLKAEDFIFRIVHIKKHSGRNLKDIQSRLIGKKGKTRRTISEISGCEVLIREGEVGILGDVESVEDTESAIVNLIKGSKQSNMYRYLESRNKTRKESFDVIEYPKNKTE